jgi:hypothetical protein
MSFSPHTHIYIYIYNIYISEEKKIKKLSEWWLELADVRTKLSNVHEYIYIYIYIYTHTCEDVILGCKI